MNSSQLGYNVQAGTLYLYCVPIYGKGGLTADLQRAALLLSGPNFGDKAQVMKGQSFGRNIVIITEGVFSAQLFSIVKQKNRSESLWKIYSWDYK